MNLILDSPVEIIGHFRLTTRIQVIVSGFIGEWLERYTEL